MPLPWAYGPVEFTVPGDEPSMVELKVPHRATIRAIKLNQLNGADDGQFRILSSRLAAQVLAGSSASAGLEGVDPDDYSVVGVKAISGGQFNEFDGEYFYRNRDGTYSMPDSRLYLLIEPSGAGDKDYALAMEFNLPNPR